MMKEHVYLNCHEPFRRGGRRELIGVARRLSPA